MENFSEQFRDWVAKQDPNDTYDYLKAGECAIAKFLTETGLFSWVYVTFDKFSTSPPGASWAVSSAAIPDNIKNLIGKKPPEHYDSFVDESEINTFGELQQRLELV